MMDNGGTLTLQPDDRLLFLGDSITEADPGYTRLFTAMQHARRPAWSVQYIYAGVSGNRVGDLQARLAQDVLAKKPTLVSVNIGINDVWHGFLPSLTGTPIGRFQAELRDLLDRLQSAGIRLCLMTPTVITEDPTSEQNRQLETFAEVVRQEAASRQTLLADTRQAFLTAISEAAGRVSFTTDGVHMNLAGNLLMADTLWRTLVP